MAALVSAPGSPAAADTTTFTGTVSSTGPSYKSHPADVTGRTVVSATLTWSGSANLDLFLTSSDGVGVANSVSAAIPVSYTHLTLPTTPYV